MRPSFSALISFPVRLLQSLRMKDQLSAPLLTRSLYLEEGKPPLFARRSITISIIALLAFILWANFTPLHEVANGQGVIMPDGFVQDIQHLEGGIIRSIKIKTGQKVHKDDPLIVLDDTATRSELLQAKARFEGLALGTSRLLAFAEGRIPSLDVSSENPGIGQSQRVIFDNQVRSRQAQLDMASSEIESRRRELDGLKGQIIKMREELGNLSAELAEREPLFEKKLVRLPEFRALQRQKTRMEGDLNRLEAQALSAKANIEQSTARYQEVLEQTRKEALTDLTRMEIEKAETASVIARMEDKLNRLVVRAPSTGLIKDVKVKASTQVITPGGVIAEIVPDDDTIFADIDVQPTDIGYIHKGMPAKIKISTYDFSRYGGVDGIVEHVSPSSFETKDNRIIFKARIKLDSSFVGARSAGRSITPGMTVTADIRTGEKSLMAYLLKPVRTLSDRSFVER